MYEGVMKRTNERGVGTWRSVGQIFIRPKGTSLYLNALRYFPIALVVMIGEVGWEVKKVELAN
jgi:hypothetical protein